MRSVLFGGTFDPVHRGHLDLARLAREGQQADHVIFIPCARSPFKAEEAAATPEQRLEMLRLAIAGEGWETWAETSRFEIDRPPPSYAWQTADHYRRAFPGAELHWLLGADQWNRIDSWAEPDKLRLWLRFLVVTRQGEPASPRPGWQARFIAHEHPASASAIRSGQGDPAWLPDAVAAYCRRHGIYPDAGL